MKRKFWTKILWVGALILPAIYFSSCSYVSHKGREAFSTLSKGDTEEQVIAKFGTPTRRQPRGVVYRRYANDDCTEPCIERLWFENKLSPVDEAWAVSLDSNRRVIAYSYYMSP